MVCNQCGLEQESDFLYWNSKKQIRRCRSCSQVFTFPFPYTDENNSKVYNSPKNLHTDLNVRDVFKCAIRGFFQMIDIKTKNKKFIDIGCGSGESLEIALKYKMDVYGVEINPYQVEYLKKQNFKVLTDLSELQNIKFDIIMLNHVMEHIAKPLEFLNDIKEILAPTGILMLTVPNFDSLIRIILRNHWVGFQTDQHLWHFEPYSMKKLLDTAGFTVTNIKKHSLGYGIDTNNKPTYEDAKFLINSNGNKFWHFINAIINKLDFKGYLGYLIRRLLDFRGDNLYIIAQQKGKKE